jgi:hypothetical protein
LIFVLTCIKASPYRVEGQDLMLGLMHPKDEIQEISMIQHYANLVIFCFDLSNPPTLDVSDVCCLHSILNSSPETIRRASSYCFNICSECASIVSRNESRSIKVTDLPSENSRNLKGISA